MGTRNKKINVERVGNSGHPITTNPTPVRYVMFQDKIPYTTFSNGTVVQSTVNRDGVNEQILRKSNLNPAYKLEVKHDGVSTPDTLGLYKANHPNDLWAYDKLKPGTKEYKEAVEKFDSYGIPLATYGEAYDNLKEVERQTQHLQPGGSIASRLWNKWTGKDTYTDGYGATRHHVPVRESAHRTALKAADSPLVQAIPVVGDVADGYVAADYAAKGNYKPAMAAIGAGLVLPDVLESGARYIPKDTWKDMLKKVDDVDLDAKLDDVMTGVSDDVKKYLDDVKSGKVKLTKDISELTDNEKEALIRQRVYESHRKGRIPNDTYQNFGPNDLDIDKPYMIPEEVIADEGWGTQVLRDNSTSSKEPWWGWDPVEYQQGGEIPSNDQQQQLFVAIITDMAKTLGVEPSQEFAEAVLTAFENQDDSQGLLTLFTKTKDKFMNETGLFREGGKMIAFVNKFKCGGKAKKAFKPKKKQEGGLVQNEETGAEYITTPVNDAKARRQWRERTGGTRAEARTAQDNLAEYLESLGGIAGRSARNSAAAMMGDPQKFAIPSANPVLKTQPAQINENPQLSGIVPVNQDGGRVFGSEQYPHASRKDAIDAATDQLGLTRAQARLGYKNQKNALRNQGYSGNEMRQAARYNIIDQAYPRAKGPELPVLDENIEIDDTPIEINDSFVPLKNEPINIEKIDTFGGSFDSAFGAARRSGLDEFTWNGKRYNTKLAPSQSAPLGKAQSTVNKVVTEEGDSAATKRKNNPGVWFPGRPSR